MAKARKAPKKRATKYEKPLNIHGGFSDVIKVAMTNPGKPKEKAKKTPRKKG